MKKIVLSMLFLISLSSFATPLTSQQVAVGHCDDMMFDAMDWAAEAGLDDQQIAAAGNAAYAYCWLMNRNLIRDSGQGVD
ncbi:hypothetical protein [Flavobacterium sp. J27]|uniref:hypothetical protein n=1 Tax=Flavobacterium sp. J27 TaxID=2060419 RepID=UPI0010300EDC|nr:hypothetical protein [Flavobacterium sp. J27]